MKPCRVCGRTYQYGFRPWWRLIPGNVRDWICLPCCLMVARVFGVIA
jgi:hypothetical protein